MDCFGRDKRDGPRLSSTSTMGGWRDREREWISSHRSRNEHGSIPSKEEHRSPDYSNSRLANAYKDKQADKDWSRRHSSNRDGEKPFKLDRCHDDSIDRSWSSDNGKSKPLCDNYKDDRCRNGFLDEGDRRSLRSSRDSIPDREKYRNNSRERDSRDRSLNSRDRDRERDRERERERPRERDKEREREFRVTRRDDDTDWEKHSNWHVKTDDSPNSMDSYEQFNYSHEDNCLNMDAEVYRNESPNSTIMIRGLAQHITENDIRQDILQCSLMPKDIRLIRKKDTGTSRGFAFVEFNTLQEASRWMEIKKGVLMLQDQYRAVMHFSIPKDTQYGLLKCPQDWYCAKCGAHNFKRRDTCYKCRSTREEAEVGEGIEEVTYHATKTILLRGLDALSTIESVIEAIKPYSSVPIVSVRIGQDSLTNASRGLCYIDLNSEMDAMFLYDALAQNPPFIDGRRAMVSYYKPAESHPAGQTPWIEGSAGVNPRWVENGGGGTFKDLSQYTLDDVPRLAEYSASMYATTPSQMATYNEYYKQYYSNQLSQTQARPVSTAPQISGNQSDSVNAAAALAQAAIQQAMAAKEIKKSIIDTSMTKPDEKVAYEVFKIAQMKSHVGLPMGPSSTIPLIVPALPGKTNAKYSVPDVSTYQYDETSGYYYDPQTGLYYDATSQYYFNSHTQQFLYWDAEQQTYMPAPNPPTATPQSDDAQKEEGKKGKEKSSDKVKVAKKIAKDMERWAKTLNQKKENFRQIMATSAQQSSQRSIGAADAGYAVLERKDRTEFPPVSETDEKLSASQASTAAGLVAAYGGGSESDDEIEDVLQEEKQHTNWVKLACLLCKRQFDKKETLIKHQQVSDLHKQNLDAWYRIRGLDPNDPQQRNNKYRDRAKERRLKFGQPNAPQPNRLKEKYLKAKEDANSVSYEEPTKAGIGSDNVGNKMLQKMGWQEGMGLGKANQGRTTIIQTKQRTASAGLGAKGGTYGALPGETYKDCVKKMMFARYQELTEQEQGTEC